jgi:hypothetical protein
MPIEEVSARYRRGVALVAVRIMDAIGPQGAYSAGRDRRS